MVQFIYQAKDKSRQDIRGTIEAESRDAALKKVMDQGLFPVDIQPVLENKLRPSQKDVGASLAKRVRRIQVVFFIRQMSDLVGAGVNVLRALTLVSGQIRDSYFKNVVLRMADNVKDGEAFSDAMARQVHIFPKVYANLIRAGEASGKLAEVLERMAELSQRDQEALNRLKFSLIYPGLILTVGVLTIFCLLTWVVPKISMIFDDLEQALPLPTVILIATSDFLIRYWVAVVMGVLLAALIMKRLGAMPSGRLWLDKFQLKVPVIRGLIMSIEMGRFARTMSTLLANGVAITAALDVTAQVMNNVVIQKEVQGLLQAVSHGSSLNGAMRRSSVFPETVTTMVAVGEESGQIHRGLMRMAEYFEEHSTRLIAMITTLVEPVLILTLGLVVGFVVLAMLMPLLKMNLMIQ